jgi:hypothetical protein
MLSGTTVTVGLPPPVDPRIREVAVYRHEGADTFAVSAGVQVCRGAPAAVCAEAEPPGHRTYVYAALAFDEWGQSAVAYSAPLALPDAAPAVRLAGPRRARAGARVRFVASATDRDGDALTYRWRLNGGTLASRAPRLAVRLRRRGLHQLSVAVSDGHGRTTRAAVRIRTV